MSKFAIRFIFLVYAFCWMGFYTHCFAQELEVVQVYVIDFEDGEALDTFLAQEQIRYTDGRILRAIEYDEKGNVIYKTYNQWDNSAQLSSTLWRFTGSDSLKVSTSTFQKGLQQGKIFYDEQGLPAYEMRENYNAQGQKIQMSYHQLPAEIIIYGLDYEYDQLNRLQRIVLLGANLQPATAANFDFEGPFMSQPDTIRFSYSRKGIKEQYTHYHYPRKTGYSFPHRHSKYGYTLFGKRLKCRENRVDGQLKDTQHYRYRKDGQFLKTWRTDANDQDLERQVYDEKGQISKELIFQGGQLQRIIYYTYLKG